MMSGDVERGLAKLKEAAEAAPNNYEYQQTYERDRAFVVSKYDRRRRHVARLPGARRRPRLLPQGAQAGSPTTRAALAGMAALAARASSRDVVAQARKDMRRGRAGRGGAQAARRAGAGPEPARARDLLDVVAQRRARAARRHRRPRPSCKSPFSKPITLEFRDASLKSVFEVISRTSGINFVFDRDVRADTKINIFVRNTSLDDVVKLILVTNQLERKLLNENSVLIYPNTPAKQKEYKELVMRSFYLANADVKQALNLVKGMVKTPGRVHRREAQPDGGQGHARGDARDRPPGARAGPRRARGDAGGRGAGAADRPRLQQLGHPVSRAHQLRQDTGAGRRHR